MKNGKLSRVGMFQLIFLATLASTCSGAVLVSEENGQQIQEAAFGYEILEHRLDNLQNIFFKLFTSLEKVEQTRLQGQRSMLEQLNKGIPVYGAKRVQLMWHNSKIYRFRQTVNRGNLRIIEDCIQVDVLGRYLLRPNGTTKTFSVICEPDSLGGGWMVIQQRINGTVEFNRNWQEYKNGFGSVGKFSEFWFGLEKLHQLTKYDSYELAVELRNESGSYGYALYTNFKVAGEDDNYRLLSGFNLSEGTIGKGMYMSYNEKFSANNKDNDNLSDIHCGSKYKSGWWFYQCQHANLNGPYKKDPQTGRGIYWENWTNAATYSRMMIRRG